MDMLATSPELSDSSDHLEVIRLRYGDEPEYIDFLDRLGRSNASVLAYHYPFYRDMLVDLGVGDPLYLVAWRGAEMVGVLPGFSRESEAGAAYCSLPFFGPNAGALCGADEEGPSIQRALLEGAIDWITRRDDPLSASFYTPFLADDFEAYDVTLPDAVMVEKTTQYLDLHEARWSGKILYDLRKARKAGVEVVSEPSPEHLDEFFRIYRENCRHQGIPCKPKAAFYRLVGGAGNKDRVGCYVATQDGRVIAGLIVLLGPQTLSYYLPATREDSRTLQPGSLLIDRAVNDARECGIRYWNWEASPSPTSGVHKFKRKWGSAESRYRVYATAFKSLDRLRQIGVETLVREYPYFFVYPFDAL